MTGASSVDQGVRVENTVIVEMWLAAAEQDLATPDSRAAGICHTGQS